MCLGRSLDGEFQRRFTRWRELRLNRKRRGSRNRLSHAAEILIDWKQRVRFKLSKGAAEFLLNPVEIVKESSSVDVQSATAEPPIGP